MKIKTQNLIPKTPVVVILGHIDSGKTSILKKIWQNQFTEEKPGGEITQHIGAYQIEKNGKKITFIDTPGHEAFIQMRSRGAKVADVAILVVDGVEGVKEQTKEAIFHIKKAKIPMIIAINKIDKTESDPQRVKRELKKEGILIEEFGGNIPLVLTSAKTGQGLDELLELILLLAEMKELKTDLEKPAEGVIVESYLDPKRGPIISLILEQGKLKLGDIVATPTTFGKIKRIENFEGKEKKEAEPGEPIFLLGLEKIATVGEKIKIFPNLEEAQKFLSLEKKKGKRVLEIKQGQKVLNLVLKADTLGSLEAIEEILKRIPQEKVVLRILHSQIGEIVEKDVELAKTGKALVLGFRVKINLAAKNLSQREKIKIMTFEIIYDLIEVIRKLMEKIGEPEIEKIELGKVRVLVDFWKEKNRQIIGGRIIEGTVEKGGRIEAFRNEEIVAKGKIVNLQKSKKDIEIGKKGEEIGILFEGEGKIEKGDLLVIFKEEQRKIL